MMVFDVIKLSTTVFLALVGGYFCVNAWNERDDSNNLMGNTICGLFMILSLVCIWYK